MAGAIAVIIVILASVVALYKLSLTAATAHTAIQLHAEKAQKPQLVISGARVTADTVEVTISNRGPGPVLVQAVYLAGPELGYVPSTIIPADSFEPTRLSVGDAVTVRFNADVMEDFMFAKPVRVIVETDKGPYTLSYAHALGVIYVTVEYPKGKHASAASGDYYFKMLKVEVDVAGGAVADTVATIDFTLAPECDAVGALQPDSTRLYSYAACRGPNGAHAAIVVPAGVEHVVRLTAEVEMPVIQQEKSMIPADSTPVFGLSWQRVGFTREAHVAVGPGSTATVEFTIPGITWYNHPFTEEDAFSFSMIDFSWYINALAEGSAPDYVEYHVGGLSFPEDPEFILTVGARLLAYGALSIHSPA